MDADEGLSREDIGNFKHVLTKALGTHDDLEFELGSDVLLDGDTLLLCSDGLTDMLADAEIREFVVRGGDDLESIARNLITAANAAGGRDNISAVLVRYVS